ncbi:MAG: hypothetical protein ACPG31_00895 [Planctomycetota bacterium]
MSRIALILGAILFGLGFIMLLADGEDETPWLDQVEEASSVAIEEPTPSMPTEFTEVERTALKGEIETPELDMTKGMVIVKLEAVPGVAWGRPTTVHLTKLQPVHNDEEIFFRVDAVGGYGVFPEVGFNQKFEVHAISQGVSPRAEAIGHSPMDASTPTVLNVTMLTKDFVAKCRVVDQAGKPIPLKSFHCITRIHQDGGPLNESTTVAAETDKDGHLWLPAPADKKDPMTIKLYSKTSPGQRGLSFSIPLDPPFQPEVREFGDLVAVPMPLLAQGLVTESSGKPVAGAVVWPSVDGNSPEAFQSKFYTKSDRNGRYQLYAPAEERFRFVLAQKDQFKKTSVSVAPEGLETPVVLGSTWSAEGRVFLPEGLDASLIQVGISARDLPRKRTFVETTPGGLFRIRGLSGESYRVDIVDKATRTILATFFFDRESPATTVQDWGLLDIQAKIRSIHLRFVTAAGNPVRSAQIYETKGMELRGKFQYEGSVVMPGSTKTFLAHTPGHVAILLDDLAEDQIVEFEEGIPVPLNLGLPNFQTVEEERRFKDLMPRGYLTRSGDPSGQVYPIVDVLRIGGVRIPEAGTYSVHLFLNPLLKVPGLGGPFPVFANGSSSIPIHIDPDDPKSFAVPITADDWRDALHRAESTSGG